MNTWKSIETAPKDGTRILGCNFDPCAPEYYTPKTVFFGIFHPNAPGKREWRDGETKHKAYLSHWMPLPKAPRV